MKIMTIGHCFIEINVFIHLCSCQTVPNIISSKIPSGLDIQYSEYFK